MNRVIKYALMIIVVAFSTINSSSQDIIDLTLVLPKSYKGLDNEQTTRLNNRVKQVVSRNGVSSEFFGGSFIISPVFIIADKLVAEGGMKSVIKTTVELTLEVYEKDSKTIFSSTTKTLTGAGYSDNESLGNAINSISATDPTFKKFFTSVKEKISSYYAANCEKFLKKAKYCIDTKDYDAALIVLNSIPDGIECSDRAKELAVLLATKDDKVEVEQAPVKDVPISAVVISNTAAKVDDSVITPTSKEIVISSTLTLRYTGVEHYGETTTLKFDLINKGDKDETLLLYKVLIYNSDGASFYPNKLIVGNKELKGYDWGIDEKVVSVANISTKMKFVINSKIDNITLFELTCNNTVYKMRDLLK